MSDLLQAMADRAHKRAGRYDEVTLLHSPLPAHRLDPLAGIVYAGMHSISCTATRRRWILKPAAVNLFGVDQTPGEVARDYLHVVYAPRRRKITHGQLSVVTRPRSAPLLARPGEYDDMAYVDIASAYYTLVLLFGWDVDYYPGRFVRFGRPPADFPLLGDKGARNALAMTGVSKSLRVFNASTGQYETRPPASGHLQNYSLWSAIQDTLHELAWLARGFGAVYINTDGYIIPARYVDLIGDAFAGYGFTLRVKEWGRAVVYGPGRYDIGRILSKSNIRRAHEADNLRLDCTDYWSLDRLRKRSKVEHMDMMSRSGL